MSKKEVIFASTPDFLVREGLAETPEPWEDGLRTSVAAPAFEWWYFDAHLDDGSTAVIVFVTKPILDWKGPAKPNVALTITRPDGSKIARFPVFPAEAFSAAKETCDVRIGSNSARGDLHRYEVHAEIDDLAADLTFTGSVPAWRPGAGKAYFGDLDHFFAWLPAIPYGKVEGTLVYDGRRHSVSGAGYHDHNWGNIGLGKILDHWYWGRAHVGEYTLIFVEQVASKRFGHTRLPVFMMARGGEIITGDGGPLRMQARRFEQHPGGRPYPLEVAFRWRKEGHEIDLSLRNPHLLEAADLLMTLPAWQRPVLRLFSKPYYYRFNADLDLRVTLPGLLAHERGNALFEIMILEGKRYP